MTSSDLKISFARPEDCGLLLQLIKALAEYEKLSGDVVATEEKLRQTLFGAHASAEAIIARSGTDVVGFAIFFHNYSTFLAQPGLYLEDLFVKPSFRGRGYGKKLFSFVAGLARERGCGRMEWSVLDWNKPAIDFYLSLGARPMSDWTVFRLDASGLAAVAGS